jgi:hypothetical protein
MVGEKAAGGLEKSSPYYYNMTIGDYGIQTNGLPKQIA